MNSLVDKRKNEKQIQGMHMSYLIAKDLRAFLHAVPSTWRVPSQRTLTLLTSFKSFCK